MGRGISTFDLLGDIPAAQRTLMRIFLRRVSANEAELLQEIAELPEPKRLTLDEMRAALHDLLQQSWIRIENQDGQTIYTVQQQSTKR
jgi:hypothetical protein